MQADGPSPLCYQWLFNGVQLGGATNTFLILNDVGPANAGSYAVMVTNLWGCVTSPAAILYVNSTVPPVDTNSPPWLSLPGLEMMDAGLPLVSVDAENMPVVRIEWTSDFRTWTPLLDLTNNGERLYFADPDAVGQSQRFYRAVSRP